MAAIWVLAGFWIWGRIDSRILAIAAKTYRPAQRRAGDDSSGLTASDVSVIVPTVNTKSSFSACLRTWAANKPREIIIIAIEQERDHINRLVRDAAVAKDLHVKIKIVYAPVASKREQFTLGVQETSGSIIVNVDDHILWPETLLENTLPCFDDKSVGAVGTPLAIHIPRERQNDRDITPWKVALTRALWRRNAGLSAVYAASGWCWVLAGSTALFRGEILRDPRFQRELTNDYWLGQYKLDTGDDTFSSRWLQQHDWNIAIQSKPETEVRRMIVKTGWAFFEQAFRWERSTIQSFLRTLRDTPQIWKNPYVARKTIERVCRPVITTIHIIAWVFSFRTFPKFASLFLVYYIWDAARSYAAFVKEYPYMWRQLWAAVLIDYFYIFQDIWSWLTLNNTTWQR